MEDVEDKRSYLDRVPSFSWVLIMVILCIIGLALTPMIDLGTRPKPRQGKELTIQYWWNGASPRVIEQEVTSKIEGIVSAVNGVQKVTSTSNLGYGHVKLILKEDVNVSAVRFEISSLIKQIRKKLHKDVTYPHLSGGDAGGSRAAAPTTKNLLSYRINADMDGEQIKEYIEQNVRPVLSTIESVRGVGVSGGVSKYMEITYDPLVLLNYGLNASVISEGIKSFMGKSNIIGDIDFVDDNQERSRITLHVSTTKFTKDIGEMPLTRVGDKIIYLNNLAEYEYKDHLPGSYFRINGLNTIYMNISVDANANLISLSKDLRAKIEELKPNLKEGVFLTLTHDGSEELQTELAKLIKRTLLSLLILLIFVWLVSRSLKYLSIISITLVANILISVIVYYLLDIRLHIFSLAGIAVSFGILIDASIVMVDHYSYYQNRKAFLAILAALVTTIGSLVVIFFMPEYIQRDLYDFSRIIIINLSVALVVALLFVPAIIQRMNYSSRQQIKSLSRSRFLVRWTKFYGRYIRFTQKRKWIYFVVLVLAFGIPIYALPDKWDKKRTYYMSKDVDAPWYETAYNSVFGSNFYQTNLKKPLGNALGGTMRLFSNSLDSRTYSDKDRKVVLHINAKMPLGGSIHHLNDKVAILEKILVKHKEIKRFETRVEWWGASINVEFKEEHEKGAFPYYLENMVIGEILSIGGADWSTRGVSERGFSNSLRMGYRSHRIQIAGYNYNLLYKYAEDIFDMLKSNKRVTDVMIETPGGGDAVDELYMDFNRHNIALYQLNVGASHHTLKELLTGFSLGHYSSDMINTSLYLKSSQAEKFDVWNLLNSYVKVGDRDIPYASFGKIEKRKAKNSIPKENQEYTLSVGFNFLGSYDLSNREIKKITEHFNNEFPIGFRCLNRSDWWYEDDGTQYWLILLIVVIIFFMCAILFESFRQPLVIITLIPVSFIGTFLTFYFSGVNFGTGGFASLVLLSGLVVNSGIYIINEYNNSLTRFKDGGFHKSKVSIYVRAYNHKIIPVFLTVVSTVLGLVPFLMDGKEEAFWFSFAIGTSGGLLFSLIALVFIMPIFMPLWKREKKEKRTKRKWWCKRKTAIRELDICCDNNIENNL